MGENIIYKCIYRRMIKWGKTSYINVYIEEWLNGGKNVYIEEWLNGGKMYI